MNSLISFIIVLGVLVFVHELGHFLFAKLFGVKVLKFSLGFGTKLVSRKWGETEYLLSAFPLGGYVKMFGEHQGEDEVPPEEQPRSFSHKPVWQRFGIVAGGPVFNIFFAVLLFFAMFFLAGLPEPMDTTTIGKIASESAAEQAGLQVGDTILSINGQETTSWTQVSELIRESGGQEVTLVVQRDGQDVTMHAKPSMEKIKNLFGEEVGERYMLGITRIENIVYQDATLGEALQAAFIQTWNLSYLTVMGIIKIIERVIPATELGGPIRIAEIAGQQMEAGWINLVYFMGLLSVNLGILNLLPIPVLDGGHLLYYLIELVKGSPVSEQAQIAGQYFGLIALAGLMSLAFINDILRLVG
jgi:regulator of sigma E protease